MCGIVGLLSDNLGDSVRKRKWFTSMLYADALRGFDSTGMFGIPHKSNKTPAFLVKKAMPAADFLQLKNVDKMLFDIEKYWGVVGHNRAATFGKVNNANAHPFHIGNITLVHNGSLSTYGNDKLPDYNKFDVDSEAICNAINTIGIEATVEQLNGAFALVWHDARNNTFNIIRNDERPIFFAKTTELKGGKEVYGDILIGSEHRLIDWISSRQGSDYKIKEIFTTAPGDLLVFHEGNINNYEIKKLKLREKIYTATAGYLGFQGSANNDSDDFGTIKGKWNNSSNDSSNKHSNNSQPNSSAITTYRKPSNGELAILKSADLEYIGEELEVEVEEWRPYDTGVSRNSKLGNPVRGYLLGFIFAKDGETLIRVKIYNVTEAEAKTLVGETVSCTVTSASGKSEREPQDVIHADKPILVKNSDPEQDLKKKLSSVC